MKTHTQQEQQHSEATKTAAARRQRRIWKGWRRNKSHELSTSSVSPSASLPYVGTRFMDIWFMYKVSQSKSWRNLHPLASRCFFLNTQILDESFNLSNIEIVSKSSWFDRFRIELDFRSTSPQQCCLYYTCCCTPTPYGLFVFPFCKTWIQHNVWYWHATVCRWTPPSYGCVRFFFSWLDAVNWKEEPDARTVCCGCLRAHRDCSGCFYDSLVSVEEFYFILFFWLMCLSCTYWLWNQICLVYVHAIALPVAFAPAWYTYVSAW